MNRASRLCIFIIYQIALLTGCAHTDVVLRPERTTFIAARPKMPSVPIYGTDELTLRCMDWKGSTDNGTETGDQCLYFATDEQEIFRKFAAVSTGDSMRIKRNIYTSFLVNLSDQNCSTFLGRAFANKSSFDTGRNIVQDVITGSTAAAANASPPAAAGLSLANLIIGKSVDNVNSTFYFEKTFQSLAAAIGWQRELVLRDLEAMKVKPYDERPIYDVLAAVRKYDDACSIRVGLAKLQELAQETKQISKAKDEAQAELAKRNSNDLIEDKKAMALLSTQVAGMYKQLEDGTLSTPAPLTATGTLPDVSTAKPKTQTHVEKILGISSSDLKAKRIQAEAISTKISTQVQQQVIDLKAAPTR